MIIAKNKMTITHKEKQAEESVFYGGLVFSLRKVFDNWTLPVIAVERQSDGYNKKVFFDDYGLISLDSKVTIMASDTPQDETLGEFLNGEDATCSGWYAQNKDNIHIKNVSNSGHYSDAPYLIKNGVFVNEILNGLNALDFSHNGACNLRDSSSSLDVFDSGNSYTILAVSSNKSDSSVGTIIATSKYTSNRMVFVNGRDVNKRLCYIYNGTLSSANTLSQQNSSDVKLTCVVNNGNALTSYLNGTIQEVNQEIYTNYANDVLYLGAGAFSVQGLNGTIQEVVIFPTDNTYNLASIHYNINNYYNIY